MADNLRMEPGVERSAAESHTNTNVPTEAPPRGDLFARIIGFLVFVLGVAIILGVLWLAFQMYNDTNLGLRTPKFPGVATSAADIGANFMHLIFKLALLFLGSISGSLI